MRVGTSVFLRRRKSPKGDHPHACGDKKTMMTINVNAEDHPHACGDKLTRSTADTKPLGSSPCVWGQVSTDTQLADGVRIIPMRVGTSCIKHLRR